MDNKIDNLLMDIYKEVCDEHYNEGDVDQKQKALDFLNLSKNIAKLKKAFSEELRLARSRAYYDVETKSGDGNTVRGFARNNREILEAQVWGERNA